MKTVKVVALKQHVFANIPRKVGEVYEATDDVLGTLLAVGFAKILDTKVEEADPPKGKYNRRDMRAQGS